MKRFLSLVLLSLTFAATAPAATAPSYNNTSPLVAPPVPTIDARVFVNSSTFDLSFSGLLFPYETSNTRFYTNTGIMMATPGYRFNDLSGGTRTSAGAFVNRGTVSGSESVAIYATNILNDGLLESGFGGLIRAEGQNVDMGFARANSSFTSSANGFGLIGQILLGYSAGFNVYQGNQIVGFNNAPGVTDISWGVGTGNANGDPVSPLSFAFDSTPSFNATELGFPTGPFYQTFPSSLFLSLAATHVFAVTNQGTNIYIQIVKVDTNFLDTNISMEVRFDSPDFRARRLGDATVEFHAAEYDPISDTWNTNYIYLIDSTASMTNLFNNDNRAEPTFRPSSIQLIRTYGVPYFTGFFSSNTDFSIGLLFQPGYTQDEVNNNYVDYSAVIDTVPVPDYQLRLGLYPQITNYPGRVELLGDVLNLDQSQVRGEAATVIRTKNLVNNQIAGVNAPHAAFDLASTQPVMVVSNLAPRTVGRYQGSVACYSTTWGNTYTNDVTTNNLTFHVLYLEPILTFQVPVTTWELSLRATNVVVADTVAVRDKFFIEASSLNVDGELFLPFGSSWAATNVQKLLHFTNNGYINIPSGGHYGSDRTNAYAEFINRGTNVAGAQFVRAGLFDNSSLLAANLGLLSVDALTGRMMGPPSSVFMTITTNIFTNIFGQPFFTNYFTNVAVTSLGPRLSSGSDIEIFAHDLILSNAQFNAGAGLRGALRMSVTNSLFDSGPDARCDWTVTAGFQMSRLPHTSSLLGTWLSSLAANNQPVDQYWSATNRSANVAGYTNNLALGKLVLDGRPGSRFRFHGIGPNRAMYVDFIELDDNATNFNNGTAITVDPGFKVYFANANVSVEKLNGAAGGGFVWVPGFAGPLSSTNITYPDGNTYTFNIALAASKNIDSDGDGIVNGDDPTPFYVGSSVDLAITLTNLPPKRPLLTWSGLFNSTNAVQYVSTVTATNWQTLTNVIVGPTNQPLSYIDYSAAGAQRYYRVVVSPPPL